MNCMKRAIIFSLLVLSFQFSPSYSDVTLNTSGILGSVSISQMSMQSNVIYSVATSDQIAIIQKSLVCSKSIQTNNGALTTQNIIDQYIYDILAGYQNLDFPLISSIIWTESRYNPEAKNYNGTCVGLMQISTKWHTKRANSLGVTDLSDPYGNILTGCDLLSELLNSYPLPLAIMIYHGGYNYAHSLYSKGIVDDYTQNVLSRASQLRGVT